METPRPTDAQLEELAASLAPFNRRFLLTGAGFSKRWGGYLSAELWTVIASDPQVRRRTELNRILHDDFNFERLLDRVERTERTAFTDDDRQALRGAVLRGFGIQEERIARTSANVGVSRILGDIFLAFVDRERAVTSCVFTLNQDMLMERFLRLQRGLGEIAGVTAPFAPQAKAQFDWGSFRSLKGGPAYIKLHGSMNWRDAGTEVAVLGGSKEEAINRFDILRMNGAIFRHAVRQPAARLLIVGYGFGDQHINAMIADGVRSGLAIWIVDPRAPETIRDQLAQSEAGVSIWASVVGHSTCDVGKLFDGQSVEQMLFVDRFLKA